MTATRPALCLVLLLGACDDAPVVHGVLPGGPVVRLPTAAPADASADNRTPPPFDAGLPPVPERPSVLTPPPAPGVLDLDAEPDAVRVRVDGKLLGEMPLRHVEIEPGVHEVVAFSPATGRSGRKTVTVVSHKTVRVRFDLQ